ncbi:MAG: hypothetical protein HY928_07945, partial [Elusimicrobia bacterium]|nr:hypothetical protein [Elusimicrobiota bacterium]
RSTEKLLASFGLTPKLAEDGSISIGGPADLEKYSSAVGTDNLKLRDQLKAFFRRPAGDAAAPAAGAPPAGASGTGRGRRRRGRRGGRGRPEAGPAAAATDTLAEAPQDGVEAPQGAQDEAAPSEAPAPRELPADERPPEV